MSRSVSCRAIDASASLAAGSRRAPSASTASRRASRSGQRSGERNQHRRRFRHREIAERFGGLLTDARAAVAARGAVQRRDRRRDRVLRNPFGRIAADLVRILARDPAFEPGHHRRRCVVHACCRNEVVLQLGIRRRRDRSGRYDLGSARHLPSPSQKTGRSFVSTGSDSVLRVNCGQCGLAAAAHRARTAPSPRAFTGRDG